MSQDELLEWFAIQYKIDKEKYFNMTEIEKLYLGIRSPSVRRQVIKLYAYGFLELEEITSFSRRFRIKKAVFEKDLRFKSPLDKDVTAEEYHILSRER